jgi:hypothetical protein
MKLIAMKGAIALKEKALVSNHLKQNYVQIKQRDPIMFTACNIASSWSLPQRS